MELWLYDVARRALTPFATTGGSSQAPAWTPDGRRIVYRGTRAGTRNLYWKAVDGSGEEERLTTKPGVVHTPSSVSPDGRWLVFTEGGGVVRGNTIWMLSLSGDRTPRRVVTPAVDGQVSPDGRWLAYQSGSAGEEQVYATSFPDAGPRVPISSNGGVDPLWSRDGRELFYTRGERMMAVTVTRGATLSVSAPRELFAGRFRPSLNTITAFSVTPDGRRFLRVQQAQPDRPLTRIEVVLNWASQLTSQTTPGSR
jgi:Tol biopolymer transport system component